MHHYSGRLLLPYYIHFSTIHNNYFGPSALSLKVWTSSLIPTHSWYPCLIFHPIHTPVSSCTTVLCLHLQKTRTPAQDLHFACPLNPTPSFSQEPPSFTYTFSLSRHQYFLSTPSFSSAPQYGLEPLLFFLKKKLCPSTPYPSLVSDQFPGSPSQQNILKEVHMFAVLISSSRISL